MHDDERGRHVPGRRHRRRAGREARSRTATSTSPSSSRPSSATSWRRGSGVDITSNSYGSSDVDNDGYDAASQEADVIHNNRTARRATVLDRQRRAGLRHDRAAVAGRRHLRRRLDAVRRHRLGLDRPDQPGRRQRRDGVVEPRLRRHRRPGVDVVADGAYSAGDITLNTILDGRDAWETWGGTSRSTPVAAGATALVYQAWQQAARRRRSPPGFYRPPRTSSSRRRPGPRLRRRRSRAPARSTPATRSRLRSARAATRLAERVAGRRLPRHRVPGVHARDRTGRLDSADVHDRRARHVAGVGPAS